MSDTKTNSPQGVPQPSPKPEKPSEQLPGGGSKGDNGGKGDKGGKGGHK